MSAPALVLLAAGASRRLGFPKALAPLSGGTPLERLLAAGRALGGHASDPPLLVTGADHGAISPAAPPGVEVVWNPHWEAGRSGGVRLARDRRPGRDLCLAPVDVPLVPDQVFALLARTWDEAGAPPRGWLAPRHGASHGHPVVVGRGLLADLDLLGADEPLRRLRGRAEPLLEVEVVHPEVLDDLDTPADLARLRRRLGGG